MDIKKISTEPNMKWKISGVIDSDNYHEFEKEILDLQGRNVKLSIDMKEVPYITSAAIRVLLLARKTISKENLILENASKDIKEIIESSGFTDMITFADSKNEDADIFHKSFKELFADMVKKHPDDVIYMMGDESYTWEDMDKCSDIVASDLVKMGVKKGTHVGLCSANSINWLIAFYATQKLGAITVMLNFNYKTSEMIKMSKIGDITHVCIGVLPKVEDRKEYEEEIKSEDSKIKYIYDIDSTIDYRKRYDEYEKIKGSFTEIVRADDPSVIIFTSGSTGNPKGVITSTYNRVVSAVELIKCSEVRDDDIICLYLPLFHALAFVFLIVLSLLKNIKVCISKNTKPESIIETIDKYKCTYMASVPTVLVVMMNNKEFSTDKIKSLRYTLVAGEPIPEETMYELQKKFPQNHFGVLYGLSEIVPVSITDYDEDPKIVASTVGKVVDGMKLKIIDLKTGKECKIGEKGEITVYAETAMIGYYKLDIDKQAINDEGYIKTGDVGYIDEKGYLRITGRCKELIIRAGENISPNEIGSAMMDSKELIDCKVVGVPDETYGEGIAAAIIMKEGISFDKDRMNKFLDEKIAKFKIPAYYVEYKEFPLLPNGKLDAVTLKEDVIKKLKGASNK